jgi:hypothetical protein
VNCANTAPLSRIGDEFVPETLMVPLSVIVTNSAVVPPIASSTGSPSRRCAVAIRTKRWAETSQERIVMCSKLHRQLTNGCSSVTPVSGYTVFAAMRILKRKSWGTLRSRPPLPRLDQPLVCWRELCRTGFETALVSGIHLVNCGRRGAKDPHKLSGLPGASSPG